MRRSGPLWTTAIVILSSQDRYWRENRQRGRLLGVGSKPPVTERRARNHTTASSRLKRHQCSGRLPEVLPVPPSTQRKVRGGDSKLLTSLVSQPGNAAAITTLASRHPLAIETCNHQARISKAYSLPLALPPPSFAQPTTTRHTKSRLHHDKYPFAFQRFFQPHHVFTASHIREKHRITNKRQRSDTPFCFSSAAFCYAVTTLLSLIWLYR